MIAPLLTALLALASAPQGIQPEPDAAHTTATARERPTPPPARQDPDEELLRNLDVLQQLELLDHLDLFDEGR